MAQLAPGCMKVFLNTEITSLGRLSFGDEDSLLMETLMFVLKDNASIEMLKTNQSDLGVRLLGSSEKFIIPSWIEEEEEDGSDVSVKSVEESGMALPFKVEGITEFWAGQEGKEFLVGATLHNQKKEVLLSLCTETDEIEVLSHSKLYERVMDAPFYFGIVQIHWYN
jgi:hypothetical protein